MCMYIRKSPAMSEHWYTHASVCTIIYHMPRCVHVQLNTIIYCI